MLKEITARLLHTKSHAERMSAARELHALFSGISRVSDASVNPLDKRETLTAEGKALSPNDAARCLFDYMRTRAFLAGVRAAIHEARQRFPGRTIDVLYAGCGPFAPLALPLTTEFTPEQVQFTLLDIHQRSLDSVWQIVEALGLAEYVQSYVCGDAASYEHPAETRPHVVVVEMMQKALENEPQVAVTANLAPQLARGGVLVPQRITLSACLADLGREFALVEEGAEADERQTGRDRLELGTSFELTRGSSEALKDWTLAEDGARCSPPVTLHIPSQAGSNRYHLLVQTRVEVFDGISLDDYECGVTYPTVLGEFGVIKDGGRVEFRYVTGKRPGLRYLFRP